MFVTSQDAGAPMTKVLPQMRQESPDVDDPRGKKRPIRPPSYCVLNEKGPRRLQKVLLSLDPLQRLLPLLSLVLVALNLLLRMFLLPLLRLLPIVLRPTRRHQLLFNLIASSYLRPSALHSWRTIVRLTSTAFVPKSICQNRTSTPHWTSGTWFKLPTKGRSPISGRKTTNCEKS
jgi:hypothetical protein